MKINFLRTAFLALAGLTLTRCGSEGGEDSPPPPAPATITVWARSTVADFNVPIQVFVDQTSAGTISANAAATATTPPGTAGTQLQVTRPAGVYAVRAVSAGGQVWSGTVTLTEGQQAAFLLDNAPSQQGRVSFWANSSGTNTSPITVVLDGFDTLGTITARAASAPACGAAGQLTVVRPDGSYSYEAFTATGSCAWQGSLTVAADGACLSIQLPGCSD